VPPVGAGDDLRRDFRRGCRDRVGRSAPWRQPGRDLLPTGGSELAATLTELRLIDEYQLVVHPVVLGAGTPLCRTPKERINLELVESRTFDNRSVLLRHRPAAA
jgi:dihydrofolate reductase